MHEKILVTGGAGFIGTHTVIELVQAGHQELSWIIWSIVVVKVLK